MTIPQAIRLIIKQWGEHPYDINHGDCDAFANAVFDVLVRTNETWRTRLVFRDSTESSYPGHVWLYDIRDKLHFDAEEPEGCVNWRNLPVFHRCRQKGRPGYMR